MQDRHFTSKTRCAVFSACEKGLLAQSGLSETIDSKRCCFSYWIVKWLDVSFRFVGRQCMIWLIISSQYKGNYTLYTIIWSLIIIVVIVYSLWRFVWRKAGLGEGRQYGNQLAKHLGWKKNLFHTILENGVDGPSLMLLNTVKHEDLDDHQATVLLAPNLSRGISALTHRFGAQDQLAEPWEQVEKLYAEWESQANQSR